MAKGPSEIPQELLTLLKEKGYIKSIQVSPEEFQKLQIKIINDIQKKDVKNLLGSNDLELIVRIQRELLKEKSDDSLVQGVLENISNPKVKLFLKKNPKVLLFYARMVKDKEAMPKLSQILRMKNELMSFSIFLIITFFVGWAWKRMDKRSSLGVIQYLFRFFLRFSILFGLRIMVFYVLFKEQISPTFKILLELI